MSPNSHSDPSNPENPNELLDIPKWINEDYFRPIIEKDVKDFASIKHFTSMAATQPGENFAAIVVRVIIDIELKDRSEQNLSYFVKTVLELHPQEKQMYEMHIPNFIRLYKEAGVDIELAPRCVHIDETRKGITLVLEDLKRRKFKNVDRLKGFDMEHMRRVLHKVAELHAASAVNYEQMGPYNDMCHQDFNIESLRKMRNEDFIKAMREWQLPDVEEYIAKLQTQTEYFDICKALIKVDESEFNCLNHGDLWCNNIMFSEDRTLLVDFQVGKWGSPAQDLWYLITASSSLDIKVKEFDHFIQIYHTRLVECLQLLKYSKSIPTLRELHIMMIRYGDWGLITATGVLGIVLQSPDPESQVFDDYQMFVNPHYAKAMVQLFPFLNNKGLL